MGAVGHIHAASLTSLRLRRVLTLLADGRPRTTRQIVRQAGVMAVNACISELRHLGAEITCTRTADPITRAPRFTYTMLKAPPVK
jgi:hypothetical protein